MGFDVKKGNYFGAIGGFEAIGGGAGGGAKPLTDSLISYWSLDEASGNAIDAKGTNNLTNTNGVTAAAGKVAGCRSFAAASSQYFSHADNADLSTGDIDFTFCGWLKLAPSALTYYTVLSKFPGAPNCEFMLYVANTTSLYFQVSNDGTNAAQAGPATFSASVWHFFAAWHGGSICVLGFSDIVTAFDVENGGASSGAATSISTGSVTPAQASELFIAAVTNIGSGTPTVSIDSSFNIGSQIVSGGPSLGGAIAWKKRTTVGAENPTFTLPSGQDAARGNASAIATFKV